MYLFDRNDECSNSIQMITSNNKKKSQNISQKSSYIEYLTITLEMLH